MSTTNMLPRIVLTETDYERLSGLLARSTQSMTAVQEALADELARAEVVEAGEIAPTVVTMNASVEFRDDQTDQTRRMMLVYPGEEDVGQGKISVLTPIGAALIGLSEGQSIEWETRTGDWKSLTVVKVHSQPEGYGGAG